jgi:O-antigen/teichoic acid export membrane protein
VSEPTLATDVVPPTVVNERRTGGGKHKAYGKTAKVGVLWTLGGETIAQIIAIPTAVLLARILTPEEFGIAAASTFFIQLSKKAGGLGLNTSIVRMKEVREDHLASVFALNMAVSLTTWAILMVSAPALGGFYDDARVVGALRAAATVFLANFLGTVEFALLQRHMQFKQIAVIEWVGPTVFLVTSVAMALTGWGYWSLIWSQVLANVSVTGAKLYFGRWRPSLRVSRAGFADTVPFGLAIYVQRLLGFGSQSIDNLIVGGLFGVGALGFYDKAFNTVDKMTSRLALGPRVMFRIFAILHEERERFIRAYSKVVLTATVVSIPVFAGMIVAAPEFILVVFGETWMPAVLPFQLLCAAGGIRVITAYGSAAVQASGVVWGDVWRNLVNITLICALIYAFKGRGIEGAAAGVLLATVIVGALMQALVQRVTQLTWMELLAPVCPGVAGAGVVAGAIMLLSTVLRWVAPGMPPWQLLGVQVLVGSLSWAGFTLFVPFLRLQAVVDEVLDDIVPGPIRRIIDRVRTRRHRSAPS